MTLVSQRLFLSDSSVLGPQNGKTVALAAWKWPKGGCGAGGGSNEFYVMGSSTENLVVGISVSSCVYKAMDIKKNNIVQNKNSTVCSLLR